MSLADVERMEEGREEVGKETSGELQELYYPRRNGWTWPWHPLQVLAWVFIIFFTTTYFGFLVFYIPGAWRSIGYIVGGLLLVTHIAASLVTSIVDPADVAVRRRRPGKMGSFLRAVFDRKKHPRVIENLHCNLCETEVSSTAKHCSVCDKCVVGFDHHCIWLNTCIGSRNYRWFLITVFSALVGCVLLLIFTLSLFIAFFSARDHIYYACNNHILSANSSCDDAIRVFGADVPDAVFPVLVGVIGLLAVAGIGMIGYLAVFHIYLIVKGLTTYDYIVLQRRLKKEKKEEEAEEQQEQGVVEADRHGRCWFLRRKINRVNPSDGDDKGQGSKGSGSAVGENLPSPVNSNSGGHNLLQYILSSPVTHVDPNSPPSVCRYQPPLPPNELVRMVNLTQKEIPDLPTAGMYQRKAPWDPAVAYTLSRSIENLTENRGEEACKPSRSNEDHENWSRLAFTLSSSSIASVERSSDDIANCGTLAFMSSANSIATNTVPRGAPITQGSGLSATSTVECGNVTQDYMTLIAREENEFCIDGVSPSIGTESNELREKNYHMMMSSGNTVGRNALRQLYQVSRRQNGITTAVGSFSNPLESSGAEPVGEEQLRPAQETFPPPVQMSLTSGQTDMVQS